ncbi:hypothetical protein [Streptomyces sp. SP17KL33]|uniref:hypothetical protein n=1 Tax=Streptomyces sp. SP17KL33 TaxID=3002534 RepID=UPI002E76A11B|nr:hypothetical protein [Streptomyces sp. SP17KL33]MEE1837634.1 hypothetical protein [Streptomyces sp. SP17KL33]
MTAARDAEGQRTTPPPRLPAKLAAHPSVRAVLARREAGDTAGPPPVIDAEWLRELCLAAGADDAAAVGLDHPDLAGEREYARSALPGTRTLIAMAVRMNRALQDAGYRALNPSVGFPPVTVVVDAEVSAYGQALGHNPCIDCTLCVAACPVGAIAEDVLGPYLDDRKSFMDTVLRPLQDKTETLYVLPGSHAGEYARRRFPHKPVKEVTGGWHPPAQRSPSTARETGAS